MRYVTIDRAGLLSACMPAYMPAYYESLAGPQTAPHARFDVTEWLPLNE